ncbi:MAG: PRC-barrel domain-containing protein [Syntrophaceae bacterium]|nr:PRC-barrel domain-containing protein [Syntrophaceae bacterium]
MTLIGSQGEPMGKVSDFIVHLEEGKIEKIILSVNEIIKERLVALPFKPLELSTWGIYYSITREQIDLMPEFKD